GRIGTVINGWCILAVSRSVSPRAGAPCAATRGSPGRGCRRCGAKRPPNTPPTSGTAAGGANGAEGARAVSQSATVTSYVALLRAVNVAGKSLAMSALRDYASMLGLDDPRTLLQSGNLIFRSAKKPAELERLFEREAEKRLGMAPDFLVRSARELSAIIA